MKKLFVALSAACLVFSCSSASAQEPDMMRAYVLATASYCAYAANNADPDSGRARAADCLDRAAADPLLDELKVAPYDVEAFVGPDPKDAYLLINGKKGVVLAFRGTIVPPADLNATSPGGAVLGAILENPTTAKAGLVTFISDWWNNAKVGTNADHVHIGFSTSWDALKKHLNKACVDPADKDCSRIGVFLAKSAVGGNSAVFITGHSKGGALATVAARNPPDVLTGKALAVYTFSAAKSLGSEGAKQASALEKSIWRFEKDGDVVPSLPVDASVADKPLIRIVLPVYAHVGPRVFFKEDESHSTTEPSGGIDAPGDMTRLSATFVEFSGDWITSFIGGELDSVFVNWLLANEAACRRVVDRHFEVFSSVRKLARASKPEAASSTDFFSSGFYAGGKQILWGYRQWCDLLKPH
jgi:Lipase (class 3)